MGQQLLSRGQVACQEGMAEDDPACLALRSQRGENKTHWKSIHPEYPTAKISGVYDPFDGTRGACCERVRDHWSQLLYVQHHIARAHTPLTADWLRLANMVLDKKVRMGRMHSQPNCIVFHPF